MAIDKRSLSGRRYGDFYIKNGPSSPYVPNGGGLVLEPYNGTTGDGTDDLAYARVMFNPEKAELSSANPPDVILSAHKYHSSGALHEHFSIYTTDDEGTPLKRLDLDYLQDVAYWVFQNSSLEIDNDTTDYALHIHQDGALANNKQAVYINWATNNTNTNNSAHYIYSNFAHTNASTVNSLARIRNDNASSVATTLHIDQDGTGRGIDIDLNGTGIGVFIDHDDTGANPSYEIDRDGNNASKIFGMKITVDNAGAGGVGGIDFSGMTVDEAVFKSVADAITNVGTISHQIPIDIGGTIYYLVAYTHGS